MGVFALGYFNFSCIHLQSWNQLFVLSLLSYPSLSLFLIFYPSHLSSCVSRTNQPIPTTHPIIQVVLLVGALRGHPHPAHRGLGGSHRHGEAVRGLELLVVLRVIEFEVLVNCGGGSNTDVEYNIYSQYTTRRICYVIVICVGTQQNLN